MSEIDKVIEAIHLLATSPFVDIPSRDATKIVCQEVYRLRTALEKEKKRADEWQGKYVDLGEINQHLRMEIFELKERKVLEEVK